MFPKDKKSYHRKFSIDITVIIGGHRYTLKSKEYSWIGLQENFVLLSLKTKATSTVGPVMDKESLLGLNKIPPSRQVHHCLQKNEFQGAISL